jgi:hypothetical protein
MDTPAHIQSAPAEGLPDEIMDVIFGHTTALGLIKFSATCKKYRSEYIARINDRGNIYLTYTTNFGDYWVVRHMCLQLLHTSYHIKYEPYGRALAGIYTTIILPKIDHPFTRRMVQKICEMPVIFSCTPILGSVCAD